MNNTTSIPAPHGGRMIDRAVKEPHLSKALKEAKELPKILLTDESAKDLENIALGIFSPLEGFMTEEDLNGVIQQRRLTSGLPWTIPIVLDATASEAKAIGRNKIALTYRGNILGTLEVDQVYSFDRKRVAERVFNTLDSNHPGVAKTLSMKEMLLGGKVELLGRTPDEFQKYRLTPLETRSIIERKRFRTVVGFQTRNVPHLGHEYLQKTALTLHDGLFVNPVIGKKKPGDFQDEVILETYRVLLDNYYRTERVIFGVLETEMRYAGPMEAIFHAILRKNFGCSHIIIGRDHAGVGNHYEPYAARAVFKEFPDLGISPVPFDEFFYCKKCLGLASERTCPHGAGEQVRFSGTKIRQLFENGERPPPEFMRPEVATAVLSFPHPFQE